MGKLGLENAWAVEVIGLLGMPITDVRSGVVTASVPVAAPAVGMYLPVVVSVMVQQV